MKARIANGMLLSQRTAALGAILAVHGVIAYAMASGLGHGFSEIVMPPIHAEIIPEIPRPLMQREPIPAPEMRRPRIQIPPPDIQIDVPVDTPTAVTDVTTGAPGMGNKAAPPSGPAKKPPLRSIIHARVGKHFPNPDAFYPPASVRREEQGVVNVQVCVGLDGKLIEEPLVASTSGFMRLDEAALKLARAGHYLAGSVDGMPIVDCLQLPIRFKMKY